VRAAEHAARDAAYAQRRGGYNPQARMAQLQQKNDQAAAALGQQVHNQVMEAAAARDVKATLALPEETHRIVRAVPPEPVSAWFGDTEITGADWLNYSCRLYDRYVWWPSKAARDAAVLWMAHTYVREPKTFRLLSPVTPRFFVLAPGMDSGKSTVMMLFALTCPRAFGIETEPTEYGLLLSIGGEAPTVLIDELAVLVGNDKRKAGVQAVLLNGYKRSVIPGLEVGGTKLRERNKQIERVPLFAPIALAGTDVVEKSMSDNIRMILSRGVIVRMRQAPDGMEIPDMADEEEIVGKAVNRIRLTGTRWVAANLDWLRAHKPEPAPGCYRRWREIWRPLLSIADAAGEDWPERARKAAQALKSDMVVADDDLDDIEDMKAALQGDGL
jgi:hypothetical protein